MEGLEFSAAFGIGRQAVASFGEDDDGMTGKFERLRLDCSKKSAFELEGFVKVREERAQ